MTDVPDRDTDLDFETHAVVASARALLHELIEEGVDSFERLDPGEPGSWSHPPSELPPPAHVTAPMSAAPVSPGPSRPTPASAPPAVQTPANDTDSNTAATWGASPSLEEVRAVLGECTRCGLCENRRTIVFGSGNPNAAVLFVGEGPGENEDMQGLPFVGRAGELLTQMIEKGVGIPRDEVYICNIVKCRPPGNRNPLPPEVSACRPFLDGQIDAVKPRVIVSLGKPAASLLLGRDVAITRMRGTWQEYRGIPLMPTLHPAYVLRQYTPENRRSVWEDLKAAFARAQED